VLSPERLSGMVPTTGVIDLPKFDEPPVE
jgi:hypothetical protein